MDDPYPAAAAAAAPPRDAPATAPLGALVAGSALAAIDLLLLARAAVGPAVLATAACTVLAAAALLAVVARMVTALTGLARQRWLRTLGGAALALPLIIAVSMLLFRGTGIRQRWYAPYGPFVVAPVLFAALWIGLQLCSRAAARLRHARHRGWFALPVAGVAALLWWADRTLYPNQYAYLHWLLLLGTTLALLCATWLLVHGRRGAARLRWPATALLAASCPAALACALWAIGGQTPQQQLDTWSHTAARLVRFFRAAVDLDGDGHSVIFGGRDCDNTDPRIHPLAIDHPANGIDEDCDGADAPPRGTRETSAARAGSRDFDAQLRRWQQLPRPPGWRRRLAGANVVLLVLDAARADLFAATPQNRRHHPRLMRLLARSRCFTRAFSSGAGTDIGMATIFTGQLDPFGGGNVTLLAAFRDAGYRTHGVFQREVQRWLGKRLAIDGLSSRDVVVNDPHRRDVGTRPTAAQVTDKGLAFLRRAGGQRFFLWLHYFDLHEHHQVSAAALPQLAGVERGMPFYRAMLRHVDREIGRLLDGLAGHPAAARTIVVLVADHGEGLAEHPRLPRNHGDVLYEQLVRVPLAIRLPRISPRRLAQPVTIADIYPTLLDLVGISRRATYGVSLLPLLHDGPPAPSLPRPIVLYEAKQKGLVLWPWKLLVWRKRGLAELYHLEHDPGEQDNRFDSEPRVVSRLATLLERYAVPEIDRLHDAKKRR